MYLVQILGGPLDKSCPWGAPSLVERESIDNDYDRSQSGKEHKNVLQISWEFRDNGLLLGVP